MGQVLYTAAPPRWRQSVEHTNTQESLRALTKLRIIQKTVAKWKQRKLSPIFPQARRKPNRTCFPSFHRGGGDHHRFPAPYLLPFDDCLYALQPTMPHLMRSSLHRCLQPYGISRLPETEGPKPSKKERLIGSVISTSKINFMKTAVNGKTNPL